MTKNPILNALLAALYIGLVASLMYFGTEHAEPIETVLIPIAILSLFSLSAAVMACLFFYQPVRMYMEGQKTEAVKLVFQTIGSFAVITALLFTSMLSPLFL